MAVVSGVPGLVVEACRFSLASDSPGWLGTMSVGTILTTGGVAVPEVCLKVPGPVHSSRPSLDGVERHTTRRRCQSLQGCSAMLATATRVEVREPPAN